MSITVPSIEKKKRTPFNTTEFSKFDSFLCANPEFSDTYPQKHERKALNENSVVNYHI